MPMMFKKVILIVSLLLTVTVVSADVIDFQLKRTLTAGRLLPLCLPFQVEASQLGELYSVATIDGYKARVYAVNSVPAGKPFVVKTAQTISSLQIEADSIHNDAFKTQPLPWEGGLLEGLESGFTWRYTTRDGKTVNAASMVFLPLNLQNMNFTVNLENIQVRQFLDEVCYERESDSEVENYKVYNVARLDIPNAVTIPLPNLPEDSLVLCYCEGSDDFTTADSLCIAVGSSEAYIYNLIPQRTYYYKVMNSDDVVSQGKFNTSGRLRMLSVPTAFNIRDLGGWTIADGRQIVYGKLYRGSELNGQYVVDSVDIEMLRKIGIEAEIDLRYKNENEGAGMSAFGFMDDSQTDASQASYYFSNNFSSKVYMLKYTSYQTRIRNVFNFIVRQLREKRSIYYHCIWGADRTGMLSILLEGLMGFSYDQIVKDYELTTFYIGATKLKPFCDEVFEYIDTFEGGSLQEKFNSFFINKVGVSQEDIDDFIAMMFGQEPIYNSISEIPVSENIAEPACFDLSGRKVGHEAKGFIIKRLSQGETKKVMRH